MEKTTRSDEFLVSEYRRGISSAETELIRRYKRKSGAIVKDILQAFKNATLAERDELVNIGLFAMFIAINTYDESKGNFSTYWTTIATNEMMKCVKENSITYHSKPTRMHIGRVRSIYDSDQFYFSAPITCEEGFIKEEINIIFKLNRQFFKKGDKEILLYALDGYKNIDIARKMNITPQTVKHRLQRIKRTLADILL